MECQAPQKDDDLMVSKSDNNMGIMVFKGRRNIC